MSTPSAIEKITALAARASAASEAKRQRREAKRQEMRERHPEIAAFVDELRQAFGDGVRVIGLIEHGTQAAMPAQASQEARGGV